MKRVWGIVVALVLTLAGLSVAVGTADSAPSYWVPQQGLRWQYQLQGEVNTAVCQKAQLADRRAPCVRPDVYGIDLYEEDGTTPNAAAVSAIHAAGGRAVCYVSAGSWENWRPDAGAYPANVLGASNGWPGERYVDIRRTDILGPILDARVAKCKTAGFDAVDFDNVDGYKNTTGFPLTASHQLTFNRMLAGFAHARDMSVALKNDLEQVDALKNDFDFAINEQCAQFKECWFYDGWTAAGKAVVEVEYTGNKKKFCLDAQAHGRDAMKKAKKLLAKPWTPCE